MILFLICLVFTVSSAELSVSVWNEIGPGMQQLAMEKVSQVASYSCDDDGLCQIAVAAAKAVLAKGGLGQAAVSATSATAVYVSALQVWGAYKEWRAWKEVLVNRKGEFDADLQSLYSETRAVAQEIATHPSEVERFTPRLNEIAKKSTALKERIQQEIARWSTAKESSASKIWGAISTMLVCSAAFVVSAITLGGLAPIGFWLCAFMSPAAILFFGLQGGVLEELLRAAHAAFNDIIGLNELLKVLLSLHSGGKHNPLIAHAVFQTLKNFHV